MKEQHWPGFSKLEALGNDFVLIDARERPFTAGVDQLRRLADRRLGVGCDQILVLESSVESGALCRVRIHNADGSAAEQCGNGMRAVALWLHQRNEMDEQAVLLTAAGKVHVRMERSGLITASLGRPDFSPAAWGKPAPADHWEEVIDGQRVLVRGVSLGNPHLVLDLEEAADETQVLRMGEFFRDHPRLPRGANINLAWRDGRDRVVLRVHERGVGPTMACGSGACATAVVLLRAGLVDSPAAIRQPGGELVIHWSDPSGPVQMTGPARHVFDGNLKPEEPDRP